MGTRRLREQRRDTIRKTALVMVGKVFERKDAICLIPGDKNEEADWSKQTCCRQTVLGFDCSPLNLLGEGGGGGHGGVMPSLWL